MLYVACIGAKHFMPKQACCKTHFAAGSFCFLEKQSKIHSFCTMQPPSDLTWLNFGVLGKAQLNREQTSRVRINQGKIRSTVCDTRHSQTEISCHVTITWLSHDNHVTTQWLTWGENNLVPSLVHTWPPSPVPCPSAGLEMGSWTHWGQTSHRS